MKRLRIQFLLLGLEAAQRLRWSGVFMALALSACVASLGFLAIRPPASVPPPGMAGIIGLLLLNIVVLTTCAVMVWARCRYGGPTRSAYFGGVLFARYGKEWQHLAAQPRMAFRRWRIVTLFNIFGAVLLGAVPIAVLGAWAHARGWI